jgi:hypothetical protein
MMAAMSQMIFRLLLEKELLGLGVKEEKPFREWSFLHPKYMKAM